MEQMSEEPIRSRFVPMAIGIGQGGTSAASTFLQVVGGDTKYLTSINLSDADLRGASLVPEANRILLDKNRFGAGKNRDVSKSYATEKKDFIIKKVSEIMGTEVNTILVFYSLDGGTGSGLGPYLTALFESNALPKAPGKPCLVFGVPLLPDANAGKLGLSNTIEALKEISNLSAAKVARFILVDNNSEASIKEDSARWAAVNQDIAKYLKRYMFTTYVSSCANLDFEDRYTALRVPGCHAFCTYNPSEKVCVPVGPFVLPEGARVDRMASEIPQGSAESRINLCSTIGCTVDEPNMVGYYPEDTQGAIPIVHFAGFSNLLKITERYQQWFSQIQQKALAAEKVDATKGVGFSRIEENKDWIESQSETKTNSSAEDLFNLLGN